MSGLHFCTFVLIAVSCYAFSSSMAVRNEPKQTGKKLDLPNRSSSEVQERQKRAMGEYKELNDIIDELEENNIAQKSAAAAVQQQATPPHDAELDNMPPLTYYLLLQRLRQLQSGGVEPTYRVRTPRLGRSIDFQQWLDATTGAADGHRAGYVKANRNNNNINKNSGGGNYDDDVDDDLGTSSTFGIGGGVSRQFVSRMIKKSVPFKPRLGKRAQVCAE